MTLKHLETIEAISALLLVLAVVTLTAFGLKGIYDCATTPHVHFYVGIDGNIHHEVSR